MADNESSTNFYVGNGIGNPYSTGGSSNPFADGVSPFTIDDITIPLPEGENPFTNGEISFTEGENPFASGELSFTANQDRGSNNATIGTGNWNLSSNNATIGNGNWNIDEATYNATIGNGNWLREQASYNTTIGNGNWYWDSSSENSTLGNGNWSFGSDNSTIGNGNWDFGNNNVVIGNGNWVFTDNTVVIGNGNWFLSDDPSLSEASQSIETLEAMFPDLKSDIDSLIGSLTSEFGEEFTVLTGDLDTNQLQTFEQLILSQDDGSALSSFSDSDLTQLFASLGSISGVEGTIGDPSCFFGGCGGKLPSEPVPEPSSVLSVLGMGLIYFISAKKFKAKRKLNWKN